MRFKKLKNLSKILATRKFFFRPPGWKKPFSKKVTYLFCLKATKQKGWHHTFQQWKNNHPNAS